ncbi:unnamed protein product [Polarella glacialis]|uniref:Uncharacterized protein n=1 Tax=Polarella glacialis TaxID=89957 RepID=A0A813EDD1_POLGL|nr:unnamed protein product [Polarella glacialis]
MTATQRKSEVRSTATQRMTAEFPKTTAVSSTKISLLTVIVNSKNNSNTSNKQQNKKNVIEEKCYWNQPNCFHDSQCPNNCSQKDSEDDSSKRKPASEDAG